ncbi:uncharacterized protein METZ01_LOCUS501938 [marine metagenome]|uniref:Uncharacterized protein n=1 Tax=marine metagenome TaxID=408172 RepID=A0A383DXP4_9ZZZZ
MPELVDQKHRTHPAAARFSYSR